MSHENDLTKNMPYEDEIFMDGMDPLDDFPDLLDLDMPLPDVNDFVQPNMVQGDNPDPPSVQPDVAVQPDIRMAAEGHHDDHPNGDFDNVLGSDIIDTDPNSMHFIIGVAYFDVSPSYPNDRVADNKQFRAITTSYFRERLQDQRFVDTLTNEKGDVVYKVVAEIQGVLNRARSTPLERTEGGQQLPNGVRIWRKIETGSLKETTWKGFHFRDISQDEKEVKKYLPQPLKTELQKLFPKRAAKRPAEPPTGPINPAHVVERPNEDVSIFLAPAAERRINPDVDPAVSEIRNVMRELNVDDDTLVDDVCQKLNEPGTYTASIHTVYNEQEASPANQYLAKQVELKWCNERGTKPRFVYTFDAGDSGLIVESYLGQATKLRNELSDNIDAVRPAKRLRLAPHTAAKEFLNVFRSIFPSHCECLFIFKNVTHPETFTERFLPGTWLEDSLCQATIRGVLLCTPHAQYTGNMGPPFGSNVAQISVDWKPKDESVGQAYWWDRLPQSNLPFSFENVEEPPELIAILRRNGQAVALVEDLVVGDPAESGKVATQSARRWESEAVGIGRFALWLDAVDDERLRTEYLSAIRKVTFSSSKEPLGNISDLSNKRVADSLMSVLMKKSELSLRPHPFVLVFANAPDETFHERFFSAQSNWWNSLGRFVITTSGCFQLHVEVQKDNADKDLVPIPSFVCPVRPDNDVDYVQDGIVNMAM